MIDIGNIKENVREVNPMPFRATPIQITHEVESILTGFAKSRTLPLSQVQRSKLILFASEGKSNSEIAKEIGLTWDSVSKWRMRWSNNAGVIEAAEKKGPKVLLEAIENLLKDAPRPGCPCVFTEVQIIQILELACRKPSEYGYETSHWSLPQLAKVSVELGIVDSISPASVGRFLKYGGNSSAQSKVLAAFQRQS